MNSKRSKASSFFLMVVALFVIAACSQPQQQAANDPPPPAAPTEAPADPEPAQDPEPATDTPAQDDTAGGATADVLWYTFADTFLASVRNSMQAQESGFPSINARHLDSMDTQSTQTEQIQTAIMQGTDVLVVNIVTTGAEDVANNIIGLARDASLPIIFFNREVSDSVIQSYDQAIFVGTDADEAGVMQGQAVAEFLLKDDNLSLYDVDGNGEISYIMFRGEHGNAEAFGRTYWSVFTANELLSSSGVKLVPSPANEVSVMYDDDGISNYFLYGNWSAATAGDLMRTAMVGHSLTEGGIELILANNDDQAIGVIEALSEANFNTGKDDAAGYIPVFGVDATDVAMTNIADGRMTATILQDGESMARAILELIQNVADGNDIKYNTDRFNMDEGVAKIRIPYAIVN